MFHGLEVENNDNTSQMQCTLDIITFLSLLVSTTVNYRKLIFAGMIAALEEAHVLVAGTVT